MTDDLPIDDELEAILAARDASRLDRSRRTLFGLMRAAAREQASAVDAETWGETVADEVRARVARAKERFDWIEAQIKILAPDFLLEKSKHVDIPGAGRVQFKDYEPSLRVSDPDAFIASLGADERKLLVEQRDHLRTNEAKTYATNVLQESGEVIPGIERIPAHRESNITFTPSLPERRQQ